jgi:hypothetical protein
MIKYVIHDTVRGWDGTKYSTLERAQDDIAKSIAFGNPKGRFVIRVKDGNKILDTIKGD